MGKEANCRGERGMKAGKKEISVATEDGQERKFLAHIE